VDLVHGQAGRPARGARTKNDDRPCDPDDIVKVLDRLYRQRKITLEHARILRIWGERGKEPSPTVPQERGDYRLWSEAVGLLESPLQVKGIIKRGDGP
jgi:hypothetical protein